MNLTARASVMVLTPDEARLDASRADSLRTALEQGLGHTGRLVLDLKGVKRLDSTILGVLAGTLKNLSEGQVLALCGLGPVVKDTLHLTRLDRILPIHEDIDEAVAALR